MAGLVVMVCEHVCVPVNDQCCPPPVQEVNPGVHQYVGTCLQHHSVWGQLDFWKNALYSAIQVCLVQPCVLVMC